MNTYDILKLSSLMSYQTWLLAVLDDPNDPQGSYKDMNASSAKSLQNKYEAAMIESLGRNNSVSSDASGYSYGFRVLIKKGSDSYAPLSSHATRLQKVSNAPYKERVLTGEIVMSEYKAAQLSCTSYPSDKVIKERLNGQGLYSFRLEDLVTVVGFKGTRFFLTDTIFIQNAASRDIIGYYYTSNVEQLPPLQITAEDVIDEFLISNSDSKLVTEVLSDINKGTVDALTALAEMPETLRSVIAGLGMVADLLRSVKNKEISLTRAFDNRKKFLSQRYSSDLETIRSSRYKSEKLRRRDLRRREQSYRKAVQNSTVEFNSAVAGIWLNFRYNIMPTVYLIEDVLKTLDASGTYITRRDGFPSVKEYDVLGNKVKVNVNSRCTIKRRLKQSPLKAVISANFLTTAWELVPLSFVVDWFVSIGDFISSITMSASILQEAACWAERKDLNTEFTNSAGQKVVFSGSCYHRTPINPQALTGICFKYEMDLNRYRDAIALLWVFTREKFRHTRGSPHVKLT